MESVVYELCFDMPILKRNRTNTQHERPDGDVYLNFLEPIKDPLWEEPPAEDVVERHEQGSTQECPDKSGMCGRQEFGSP